MSLRAMNSPASDRRGTPDYQQEHISPQTRQDTKGTSQSCEEHGALLSMVPQPAHGAFTELFPTLPGRCTSDLQRLACSLQDLLQRSPLLQCLDLVYLLPCQSSFLILPEIVQMLKMWHGKRWCCLADGDLCLSAGCCTWKSTAKKETTPWYPSTASPPTHGNQHTPLGWEKLANKMQFPTAGNILQ